jgi:hypothetical protein
MGSLDPWAGLPIVALPIPVDRILGVSHQRLTQLLGGFVRGNFWSPPC